MEDPPDLTCAQKWFGVWGLKLHVFLPGMKLSQITGLLYLPFASPFLTSLMVTIIPLPTEHQKPLLFDAAAKVPTQHFLGLGRSLRSKKNNHINIIPT